MRFGIYEMPQVTQQKILQMEICEYGDKDGLCNHPNLSKPSFSRRIYDIVSENGVVYCHKLNNAGRCPK